MAPRNEIDVSCWGDYLAAFDDMLAAVQKRDVLGVLHARRRMLRELDSESMGIYPAKKLFSRWAKGRPVD